MEPSGAYPNLSLGPGPKALQGPPELSCELSTFPSVPFTLQLAASRFTQTPSLPILGGFWMRGLYMQWVLLCTVYRARLNTLRVSSRAQQ